MSKPKILTREIAEEFLKDNGSVDLDKFTDIEETAAEVIAQHKGELCLNGLKTLSDAAAIWLAKHEGKLLLNRVTSLSDPAVEALAQHKGELCFGWAKRLLTKHVADEFLKKPDSINLNLFAFIENAAAQIVAQRKGDLFLDGLKSLSDASAHSLADHKGDLSFYRLKSLSDAAAYSLAKHEGRRLLLHSITTLSDAAVQALAKHEGEVWLGGKAKAALAKEKKTKLKTAVTHANRAATSAGISLSKVKKLITANKPESFTVAVEMSRAMELDTEATWLSLLTKSRIAQLDKLGNNHVTKQLLEIGETGNTIGKLVIASIYFPHWRNPRALRAAYENLEKLIYNA